MTRSVKSQHVDSTPYKRRRGAALYRYLPRVLQASSRALYVEQMFDDLAREVEAVEALPRASLSAHRRLSPISLSGPLMTTPRYQATITPSLGAPGARSPGHR